MPLERLQKIIAGAGISSRRKAEELITSGRVIVNGTTVTELGSKADPETDHIRVDGKLLRGRERNVYVVLNKPKGYVTTVSDPEGRPTVMKLVKSIKGRVYPVGRLDYASEGLLLLTNDGDLAHKLMHSRAEDEAHVLYGAQLIRLAASRFELRRNGEAWPDLQAQRHALALPLEVLGAGLERVPVVHVDAHTRALERGRDLPRLLQRQRALLVAAVDRHDDGLDRCQPRRP